MTADAQEIRKENSVLDYLEKLGNSSGSYQAIWLNMHLLDESSRLQQNKQAIMDAFVPLLKEGNAKIFSLENDDVVIIFPKKNQDIAVSALIKVKFVLHNDSKISDAVDLESTGIAVWYDLNLEYGDFAKKASATRAEQPKEEKKKETEVSIKTPVSFFNSTAQHFGKKLTPEMLATVQKIISVSDFSSFIRRQAVCAIIGKSTPQRVFEEVFVSIPDMRDSLLAEVDITSNPWLFLALTETLDKRVLEIVSRHDDGSLTGNFSVNINVATILSDAFLHFDDSISGAMRQTITLELQLVDIFSDIRSFVLAKTFAKARGYKICIDGITAEKLKYLNRSRLECDLMKFVWSPALVDVLNEDQHFMDYMNKAERAKIILCRVEDEKAIETGNSLGINLYQGRYVQSLLNAANNKR